MNDPAGPRRSWLATWAPALDDSNIRKFLFAQHTSNVGSWMQMTAEAWIILELTGSGTALGIHALLKSGPIIVLGSYGGLLVDRYSRVTLLKITQSTYAALSAVLLVILLLPDPTLTAIYTIGFLDGLVAAVDNALRRGVIRDMTTDALLPNAIALNSTFATVSRTIGPALGGLVIVAMGPLWCIAFNVVAYLLLVVTIFFFDESTFRPHAPTERGHGQIREGLRYAWRDRVIRDSLVIAAVVGIFGWSYSTLMPLYATEVFDGDATTYGGLLSAAGFGAFFGALATARLLTSRRGAALGASILLSVALAIVTLAITPTMAAVGMFLVGAAATSVNIDAQTNIQLHSSDAMSGRVLALFSIAFIGSRPLGGAMGGWVADQSTPRVAFGICATAIAVLACWQFVKQRRAPA